MDKLSETVIQDRLATELMCRSHSMIIPNCYFFGVNESDMLSVTKAGYIWEFEIKISKQDFHNDRNKRRHDWYNGGKELRVFSGKKHKPNRFWYVVPSGLLDGLVVPDYAGVMEAEMSEYDRFVIITKSNAPMLHKEKVCDEQLIQFGHKLSFRYWDIRHHANDNVQTQALDL